MDQAAEQLLIRIIAACATLIGFIIFFFILNWYAYRKALKEMKKFEGMQRHHARKKR